MRTRLCFSLIAALVCCTVPATPALSASPKPAKPAEIVADGPVTLTAYDDGDTLCLGLDESGGGTTCSRPEDGIVIVAEAPNGGTRYVGTAVDAAAARVEVRRAGRLLGGGPTVDGAAYSGRFAATVRFALVRIPVSPQFDGLRVHAFDAAGTLIGVASAGRDDERVFDRRRVLSGRSGNVRWLLSSHRTSRLTPALFDLAHETLSRCVDIRISRGLGSGGSSSCVSDAPRDTLGFFEGSPAEASSADQCGPDFRLVNGVVASSVQRVTVLLGDGSRRKARTAALPGRRELVYALTVGRGDAVRGVELDPRSGATRTVRLAKAPLTVVCADESRNSIGTISSFGFPSLTDLPLVTPVGPVTTIPGTPPMRVADGPGDTLCVALAALPFNAFGCAIVGPDLEEVLGATDNFTAPRSFALAVPATVATVRISGAGGMPTQDIATVAGTGYAGRYGGLVRFAAGTVAKTADLAGITYLDATGKVLFRDRPSADDETDTSRTFPARRIAGRAGAPSLWQTTTRFGSQRSDCLQLTSGRRPPNDETCATFRSNATVLLEASCATRRLTVAVAVTRGSRVFADTGDGPLRPITLRNGAGITTLAPGRPLRSVRIVRKGTTKRVAIDAPPAGRQCGWTAAPGSEFGG